MVTPNILSPPTPIDRPALTPSSPGKDSSILESLSVAFHPSASAGSLGVRGLISDVRARDHHDLSQVLQGSIQVLRDVGVRRAHIFVDHSSDLREAAIKEGFRECPGEHLHQSTLRCAPLARSQLSPCYQLRDGTEEDLVRIGLDLTHVKELAFESWEIPLIRKQLHHALGFFKVIENEGAIVGVSIGGSSGQYGTISHTWVAPELRGLRLGQALSDASLASLYSSGARSVYLMTTAGNSAAERFWQRQGFYRNASQTFLEIDL